MIGKHKEPQDTIGCVNNYQRVQNVGIYETNVPKYVVAYNTLRDINLVWLSLSAGTLKIHITKLNQWVIIGDWETQRTPGYYWLCK